VVCSGTPIQQLEVSPSVSVDTQTTVFHSRCQ
jgi:hypothetical protein